MKKLIYALYGGFVVLMGATFYVAHTANDGLVERHYYEKARDFFSDKQREKVPDCDIDKGMCSRKTGNGEVILDITPRPVKAMEELAFRLVVKPHAPSARELSIDLSMPGMYMGNNQVLLKKGPDGTYAGNGVIPRCRSGSRRWKAATNIPETGKVDFTFDVSY